MFFNSSNHIHRNELFEASLAPYDCWELHIPSHVCKEDLINHFSSSASCASKGIDLVDDLVQAIVHVLC
jgi:hypothetical protein